MLSVLVLAEVAVVGYVVKLRLCSICFDYYLVMIRVTIFVCSTTENLAVKIWTSMTSLMTANFPDVELHKVKVHETDKNVVTYRGELSE